MVGPGLSEGALVSLTRQMRDLGVKRFEVGDVVVEMHDAAVMLALQPPPPPLTEAGDIEADRQRREEESRRNNLELDLASA